MTDPMQHKSFKSHYLRKGTFAFLNAEALF